MLIVVDGEGVLLPFGLMLRLQVGEFVLQDLDAALHDRLGTHEAITLNVEVKFVRHSGRI